MLIVKIVIIGGDIDTVREIKLFYLKGRLLVKVFTLDVTCHPLTPGIALLIALVPMFELMAIMKCTMDILYVQDRCKEDHDEW